MSVKTAPPAVEAYGPYTIGLPTVGDVRNVGDMLLQACVETYVNPELGVDEAFVRQKMGYLAGDVGNNVRTQHFWRLPERTNYVHYRVAKDQTGAVVAVAAAEKELFGDDPYELDLLYLLNTAQGKKLGGFLMRGILDWAGSDRPIELSVVDYNQRAIDFYRYFGFEPTGEKDIWAKRGSTQDPIMTQRMRREAA